MAANEQTPKETSYQFAARVDALLSIPKLLAQLAELEEETKSKSGPVMPGEMSDQYRLVLQTKNRLEALRHSLRNEVVVESLAVDMATYHNVIKNLQRHAP